MATKELENAALRPGDVAGRRFTIGKRGYEPEEVHQFLQHVGEYLERLQGEIEWQRARVEHLEQRSVAARDSAYDRISREFMQVVRRADEAAGQVRAKAEDEARIALGGARKEANRMMASAAQEAERVLVAASAEAERLVAEATRQVERLIHDAAGAIPARRDDARQAGNGHASPRQPAGANGHSEAAVVLQDPPEPVFAEFAELNLEFEGSMFDLFGEAGV